jgi:hypothetical protein
MRDFPSYNSWRDMTADGYDGTHVAQHVALDGASDRLTLPSGARVILAAALLRPEVPAQIELLCGATPCAELVIDRNDRYILAHTLPTDDAAGASQRGYFPEQPLPFLAEVVYLMSQIGIWSLCVFAAVALLVPAIAWLLERVEGVGSGLPRPAVSPAPRLAVLPTIRSTLSSVRGSRSSRRGTAPPVVGHQENQARAGGVAEPAGRWRYIESAESHRDTASVAARAWTVWPDWLLWLMARRPRLDRWDVLAALLALASLGATLYVALVPFAGQPHILDASSYLFQAKIFASGRLAAPAPALDDAFKGPFMIALDGRWFSFFAPGTSAVLALGLLLRVPWAVSPVLGTLALWGVYRLGRQVYNPWTGCLALALGALSPFYTYLAASYMSHTLALLLTVVFLLALVRYGRRERTRDLALAAACVGALLLVRELDAALLGLGLAAFLLVFYLKPTEWGRRDWRAALPGTLLAGAILVFCASVYLAYNALQTGDPLLTPRNVFLPTDHYGFGENIGFYGQHTPAAGLVILDQLLTSLLIDLFGWPFYLTLVFIPFVFLRRVAIQRWDLLCLGGFAALTLAQGAYFYHGIYLGPRHLYEALPFLLLLTARGIVALPGALAAVTRALWPRWDARRMLNVGYAARGATIALLLTLGACSVCYYIPRQLDLYAGFTGLPYWKPVDAAAIYAFHPANAVVVTGDWFVYNYIAFPLNDPDLRGPVVYAYSTGTETPEALRAEYPGRTLFQLHVAADGHVSFAPLP